MKLAEFFLDLFIGWGGGQRGVHGGVRVQDVHGSHVVGFEVREVVQAKFYIGFQVVSVVFGKGC